MLVSISGSAPNHSVRFGAVMSRNLRRRTAVVAVLALALTTVGGAPARAAEVEQLKNGGFDGTSDPWWSTAGVPITLDAGRACIDVPGGTGNRWDVAIGQNDVPLVAGQ